MVYVRVPRKCYERVDVQEHDGGSVLIERTSDHLGGDGRRTGRHPDHRQPVRRLYPRWRQPAASELGDDRPQGAMLTRRQLTSCRDHILVDIERRSHKLMLAHQRITRRRFAPPGCVARGRRPENRGILPG